MELALARWTGGEVAVRYRAFFLNPAAPLAGEDFQAVMHSKTGGRMPLESLFQAPRERGASVGLNFAFEKITRTPNTLLSHELAALALADRQSAVLEDIYAAYFEYGQDIGELEVLLEIASRNDMDREEVRQQLLSHTARAQVIEEVRQAHALGIQGVPFFVFNRRYGLSGAQPPEAILQALQAAAKE